MNGFSQKQEWALQLTKNPTNSAVRTKNPPKPQNNKKRAVSSYIRDKAEKSHQSCSKNLANNPPHPPKMPRPKNVSLLTLASS